jgi:GTP 3',8-cyclase
MESIVMSRSMLVDSLGRQVKKLRLSLTDKCNLRCAYCMPVNTEFMSSCSYLKPFEITAIVGDLCSLGLEEVRLTGGEPLLRAEFSEIVVQLSKLPIKKIKLTTNGIYLEKYLKLLKEPCVRYLNISLDTLKEKKFREITRVGGGSGQLAQVIQACESALKLDFKIKINMVVLRGINDDEIFDFVELSKKWNVEVRFLEVMKIGEVTRWESERLISAAEILEQLRNKYRLEPALVANDSTSFNYSTSDGARVGFIASETQAFCGQCSRWRLSAEGIMRACLFKEDGIVIKNLTQEQRREAYQKLLGMKPALRPSSVSHQMNRIGG